MREFGNALIGTVDSQDETEYNFKEEFDYLLPISLIPCHVFRSKPCHFPWS